MRNGYALATETGLRHIQAALEAASASELDGLRSALEVGVHWDVQVTELGASHAVTQVYCSALPVAYGSAPRALWSRFAKLVLEAAYEATLLAGLMNMARTGNSVVYLTRLGGGAFGNAPEWIHSAMTRAVELAADWPLDLRVVSYGPPDEDLLRLVGSGLDKPVPRR